jgi:hypothetical protein
MDKRKGNNGNHGAKGKSGRKPKAITLLKRKLIEDGKEDAEYAYSLFASVMRDGTQPLDLRMQCASWIADRVLGKPNQPISGKDGGAIQVKTYISVSPDDWDPKAV